jgi:tetratricopeptide (TPR) repeat protein
MKSGLVEIEQKALNARNAGRLEEAAKLYETTVTERPDYEHGTAMYCLACCYEDLKNIASAEECFRKALQYEPENPIFLGGLASFLYIHGDPAESFQTHLVLLRTLRGAGLQARAKSTETALKALAERIGMSDGAVADHIDLMIGNGGS